MARSWGHFQQTKTRQSLRALLTILPHLQARNSVSKNGGPCIGVGGKLAPPETVSAMDEVEPPSQLRLLLLLLR